MNRLFAVHKFLQLLFEPENISSFHELLWQHVSDVHDLLCKIILLLQNDYLTVLTVVPKFPELKEIITVPLSSNAVPSWVCTSLIIYLFKAFLCKLKKLEISPQKGHFHALFPLSI